VLALVVTAAALSVNAATAVLQHRRIATVIVRVAAVPKDVQGLVRFRRLGELQRPDGALNWPSDVRR